MTVKELYGYFDKEIPKELSCSWDNDGLMCCPDPEREVRRALITLDITENAVCYAIENGFDVIVSHHPIIFRPLKSITSPKLVKLISNGISAMSFHTRLDAVSGGVNDCLAAALGLENTEPFGEDMLGRIGYLPKPMTVCEFSEYVKKALGCERINAVSSDGRMCKRVAVVGGDGKEYTEAALNAGADTYLTGSMSYNSMTDSAELDINVLEVGHFYTENPVCRRIGELIKAADGSVFTEIYYCNLIKEL